MKRQNLVLAVFVCAASMASAQFVLPPILLINQGTDVPVALGEPMAIRLFTAPSVPFLIAFSVDPGPTDLFGRVVPLGTSAFVSHENLLTPPNGNFVDGLIVPMNPALLGFSFFGAALTIDPAQPQNLGISNQVRGTLVIPASAGPPTAGFAGDPIVLDGSLNRDPATDNLPLGTTLSWAVDSGPANHGAVLENSNREFPTLKTQTPGSYVVRLTRNYPGIPGTLSGTTTVDVFGLTMNPAHGTFTTLTNTAVLATITGPPRQNFGFVGGAPSSTQTAFIVKPAGTPLTANEVHVVSNNGQSLRRGHTLINNTGTLFGAPPASSFALHLKQPAINNVAAVLEGILESTDLGSFVEGGPFVNIASVSGPFGITTFSANVRLLSLAYAPNLTLSLVPQSGMARGTLVMTNVVMVFAVVGEIFGVNYTETATLSVNVATGVVDTQVQVSGGIYTVTPSTVNTTLSGVSLSFNSSIISAFTSLFLSSIIPEIEDAIDTVIADTIPDAFEEVLNGIPQELSLSPTVDISFDFRPETIVFSPGQFTLGMAAGAHPLVMDAGAVVLSRYYSTAAAVPVFPTTVPGTSVPFSTGLAIEDDFLNQAMTALVRSGTMNFDFSAPLTVQGQTLILNCGNLSLVFPGLGFEKFSPSAPALLRVYPTTSPIARISSIPGEDLEVFISDLIVDLVARPAAGYEVLVASFALGGTVGMNTSLNLVQGSLTLTPGTVNASAHERFTMPGVDASPIAAALPLVLPSLVPALISGLGTIPLPDVSGTGLGTSVIDLVTQGQFLVVYAN